jgi:hypothetical protein
MDDEELAMAKAISLSQAEEHGETEEQILMRVMEESKQGAAGANCLVYQRQPHHGPKMPTKWLPNPVMNHPHLTGMLSQTMRHRLGWLSMLQRQQHHSNPELVINALTVACQGLKARKQFIYFSKELEQPRSSTMVAFRVSVPTILSTESCDTLLATA